MRCKKRASSRQTTIQRGRWIGKREDTLIFTSLLSLSVPSADQKYYSIDDINKNCLEEFRKHWTCLDNNNQQLWQCRPAEWKLNDCVFNKLVCQKAFFIVYAMSYNSIYHISPKISPKTA